MANKKKKVVVRKKVSSKPKISQEVLALIKTRANSVGKKISMLILDGRTSVNKVELILEADKMYAKAKGKTENATEANWLTRQIIGALVGIGFAEDGGETLYFKPVLIKAVKEMNKSKK